jgi:hypothetical protein
MRIGLEIPAHPLLVKLLFDDDQGERKNAMTFGEGVELSLPPGGFVERRGYQLGETIELVSLTLTVFSAGVDLWTVAAALSDACRRSRVPKVKVNGRWAETTPDGLHREFKYQVKMKGAGEVAVNPETGSLHVKLVEDPPEGSIRLVED